MNQKHLIAAAIPFLLFGGHLILERLLRLHWTLLDHYLDPLCFLPILLTLWLIDLRWLFGRPRLTAAFTLVAGTFFIVLGEIIFPILDPAFVHDPWDYPFYLIGLAYFWFFINPKAAPGSS
ncbi:hypothetical protein [Lewinella sp. W8]|uniref:hypothetical protein n=1 Tax=Lewinella sp. W8 TaxID=2528208 RepID=UPI001067650E|nr:hypothetical protein [Lewinella sp. W8]MTB50330.1 hypothetical protein [Lewinella sp. W8]